MVLLKVWAKVKIGVDFWCDGVVSYHRQSVDCPLWQEVSIVPKEGKQVLSHSVTMCEGYFVHEWCGDPRSLDSVVIPCGPGVQGTCPDCGKPVYATRKVWK